MEMTLAQIFESTGDAYLSLIHPKREAYVSRRELAPILAIAPSVPSHIVHSLIVGQSWRERVLGLCIGAVVKPDDFANDILQSLEKPRGIVIVPSCAMLTVIAKRGSIVCELDWLRRFDCSAFDGELGWGLKKTLFHTGIISDDVGGTGPNYSQVFEDHLMLYSWIASLSAPEDSGD